MRLTKTVYQKCHFTLVYPTLYVTVLHMKLHHVKQNTELANVTVKQWVLNIYNAYILTCTLFRYAIFSTRKVT
jgi:hypothetical protein